MTGYFYKQHPESCDPEDFWGQVKRTVNGKPVSQDQIDMIVAAVADGLELKGDDVLLDLCCGNGALTTHFFQRCAGGLGVDFSDYLIEVARHYFLKKESEQYVLQDVLEFVREHAHPERYTKGLCYGAFMFLSEAQALELLTTLRYRFTNLARFFIGNLPDRDRITDFYRAGEYRPGIEKDHTSPIGVWRTVDEFVRMADVAGWNATIRRMPSAFYAAHYRYDAVLMPGHRA